MIDPREWTIPQLVCAGLGLVIVTAVLFAVTTSATAFGAYNFAWDGTSDLRDVGDENGRDASILQNTSAYDRLEGADTIAVIVGPDESYNDENAARIRNYVRRGGTVLVATDFNSAGNELLAALGSTVRVDGGVVRDERNHGPSPALPVATNVSLPADDELDRLALNYPSALTGTDSANVTTMAWTSPYAYIDRNGNEELDDSEQLQSYPVIAREEVGNGSLIAVSDPSLFINSMLDREDNRAVAAALFEPYERVRFDYTHTGGIPPLVQVLLIVRSSRLAGFVFGIAVIASLALLLRAGPMLLGRLRRRSRGGSATSPGLTEDEIVEIVAENYPEWDRDRVRRVATRLASREPAAD